MNPKLLLASAASKARSLLSRLRAGIGRARRIEVRRVRSLVNDILLLQLVFTTFLGVLAVGSLWWISKTVIEDNLQKWAQAWIVELEELGAPLYQSEDEERFLRVENYVANFPEMVLVRYYTPAGEILFTVNANAPSDRPELLPLSALQLDKLRAIADVEKPYLLDTSLERQSLFRASAPVWIESMRPGDLLNLDLEAEPADQVELIGFLELGLDFSSYQNRLIAGIKAGSLLLAVALLLVAMVGRFFLKGALKPLSDLATPLARLAAGETEVDVKSSGHKEIMAVNSALQTTIRALNERDRMLRRLADYDPLTGLPNRRHFAQGLEDEIAWIMQGGTSSALLFVDLDQFKYINDTLGHAAGDRVLVQAAACLHGKLRKHDLIARFGGDEFTLILKDISREDATRLVEQLLSVMQHLHFVEDGQSLNVHCSIGVTMIDSVKYTPDELLSQADMACHEAKARGRNCFRFYEVSGQEKKRMTEDVGWSHRIKQALKNDGFLLQYQPIIDLGSGRPIMHEVLLRMRGENNSIIPPAAFMPAANRFGLMVEIDHLVIRNALQNLARFRESGHEGVFTLNLSGYVFEDPELVAFIRENLEENRLDPSAVILEITEQVAVRQLEQARGLIKDLMAIGCRFALDDFGAGFSSFNYLKHLPVDIIKIDGGFIRNMASDPVDQAMVKSIIQVARAVGKKTIAEYVQDAETLAMLCQLGVDYAQGFHIGEPSETLRDEPFTLPSTGPNQVKWRDFQDEFILLCVQWYLRYNTSFLELQEMMLERGVPVRHTTINGWVQRYGAESGHRVQALANHGNLNYQVEEAYVSVKGQRKYLYRAISPDGNTLDFKLCDVAEFWAASDFFHSHLLTGDATSTVVNTARDQAK